MLELRHIGEDVLLGRLLLLLEGKLHLRIGLYVSMDVDCALNRRLPYLYLGVEALNLLVVLVD